MSLQFLLLQVRNEDDPIREQEVACFQRVLQCNQEQIDPWDLLGGFPDNGKLDRYDMVLLGGSGHFSATSDEPWIKPILDGLRGIHQQGKPTFASCWGFQAMSRALGGRVVHDLDKAEIGTHWLTLTEAGHADPVFGPLGERFLGQMGHEDRVIELPDDADLLASTELVEMQAYRFRDKPIYCTQFHPELNEADLIHRVKKYPEYIHRIAQLPPERFDELVLDSIETEQLLMRFIQTVFH
ncbi:MAG: type 1 glutamine amidotransferase [Planctomycetales bacterium]